MRHKINPKVKRNFSRAIKNYQSILVKLRLRRLFPFLLFAGAVFFSACSSFPPDYSSSTAWTAPDAEKSRGSVMILSVAAERPGDWGSLEKEINALLPLLFAEESFLVVSPDDAADYRADVRVREREFQSGWQTRRSLSCEVRIWRGEPDSGAALPLTAGRSIIQGKQSLASSKSLGELLKKAVKSAVSGLPQNNSDELPDGQSDDPLIGNGLSEADSGEK